MAITRAVRASSTTQTRAEMKKILTEIQSGEFAQQWIGGEQEPAARSFWQCAKRSRTSRSNRSARAAQDDAVPEEEKGSRRTAGLVARNVRAVPVRHGLNEIMRIHLRHHVARRHAGRSRQLSRPTTRSWSLPTSWTSWGSTILRAAGPGRIRRTRNSSRAPKTCSLKHARLTAFGATRFAKNPRGGRRERQRADRSGNAGGFDLRQELGSARSPRSRDHRRRESRS